MIGFIVEGHMEEKIIRSFCRSAEVRRLQINGCKFPVHRLVERISPQISMLRRKNVKKVLVIIDREQRENSSEKFEEDILNALRESNQGLDIPLQVASPDRNFESWIAPFLDQNCEISAEFQADFEGRNGKSIMRAIYKARAEAYVEVINGVRLFKKVNPQKLTEVSASFKRLVDNFNEDCWWLKTGQYEISDQ